MFSSCLPLYLASQAKEAPVVENIPKNVLVITQSGTQSDIFQTVIDLDNNELVVIRYSRFRIQQVFRTGMKANPNDYRGQKCIGTDAPFEEEKDDDDDDDTSPANGKDGN